MLCPVRRQGSHPAAMARSPLESTPGQCQNVHKANRLKN